MGTERREFLKGVAWMGSLAALGGCVCGREAAGGIKGAPMMGFRTKPMARVRVGFVGLGNRGADAVRRVAHIPGVEIAAICDYRQERIDYTQGLLKEIGHAPAKAYVGPEGYRRLCAAADVDVVYNATHWQQHMPVAREALQCDKHVFIEVPAVMTVDDCWELVETAERKKLHCMQLENSCYGEVEMMCVEMVRKGLLGEIVSGECGYIHDLRPNGYRDNWNYDYWRLKWNLKHRGNQYPTHGISRLAWQMDINRGDRFDYLVSLDTAATNLKRYAEANFPADSWKNRETPAMADVNTTLIRTANGHSITVVHDVSSPRPYSKETTLVGTRGIFRSTNPVQFGWEEKNGAGVHEFFPEARIKEECAKNASPIWRKWGEIAKSAGGHGGLDFITDLRWAYCLQNGLPLDQDVYDLASWCSICELSERSANNRSAAVDVPDFTRGAWREKRPLPDFDVDFASMGRKS